MRAWVARPDGQPPARGLLVFQEAFGVNPHIRDVTERFANAGFLAIAPDLFHRTAPGFEGSYTDFPAAMPHLQAITVPGLEADVRAAYGWLERAGVAGNAAAVGYCFGGRVAFVANTTVPLKAAASYYGGNIPPLLGRAGHLAGPDAVLLGRARSPYSRRTAARGDHGGRRRRQAVRRRRVLRRGSRVLLRRARELPAGRGRAGVEPDARLLRYVLPR